MSRIRVSVCILAMILLSTTALAQMEPPKPAPELKRLDYFKGAWTLQCDLKPSQFGPAGKLTESEHNEWMQGGFFLTTHADFTGSTGNGSEVSFMGYNPDEKVYTYDAFNSWGEAVHAKGTLSSDTWTWTSSSIMMGKPMQTRYTVKEAPPDAYTFKFEMAGADGQWALVMDGKAAKNK